MNRIAAITGLILCFALAPGAFAADGDASAGQAKAAPCAACHGADGNSVNPEWPSLAGQQPGYIVAALLAFKNGTRANPLMTPMSMALTDQDRADLAAYYSTQPVTPKFADPDLVDAGMKLYRGGNSETGVSACAACHGPNGLGNPGAKMPRLAGQHATYVADQLRRYASGERRSDMSQMMRNIAALMSDEEIEAVSSYVQGLRDL